MNKLLLICFGLTCLNTFGQDTVKIKTALTPEQEAENAYNIGLEYMTKKDFNGAIENFSKAIFEGDTNNTANCSMYYLYRICEHRGKP